MPRQEDHDSTPAAYCLPEGRSLEASFNSYEHQFNEKYKMILREYLPQQSQFAAKRVADVDFAENFKKKKLLLNKNLKNLRRSEASRKLLQRSICSQLKNLQIDIQARCVFSFGKHLYSNTLNGKLRVAIGTDPIQPLTSPLVRSFRKLQECSVYNRAALLACKTYRIVAQENCLDTYSYNQPHESSTTQYLAFFEEEVLINFTVSQSGKQFSLNHLQVLVTESLTEERRRSVTNELSSLLSSLRQIYGGEARLGDLLRLVQIKIKNLSAKLDSYGSP